MRNANSHARDGHRPWAPSDRTLAVLVGLVALALYTVTLLPGLGGPEDTPKFQLLGKVLGSAHPPGYPLYILVGHAFSTLPIATPAWRANFMSACFGAITVGVLYLIIRRAGAPRLSACALALGAAVGRSFWWDSIVAEVYTLAAALQAAAVLKLVDWSASRRARDFFAAVAWASLALGNHLSMVAIVPVFVLFAAVTDWRFAFRLRTMGLTVVTVALGLSSYLFIVVRTYQRAPYLESRISSFADFWNVLRGARFDDVMFKFDPHALVTERVPEVLRLLRGEFTWFGVVLILVGFVVAAWRAPRLALLFGGGALAAIGLALNFDSDLKGFLVPAFVMAWPLAAFAVRGDARGRPLVRQAVATAATLMALAIPVRALVVNLPHNNLRGDDYFGRYFSTLLEWAPARAAFVDEDYTIDSMLQYQHVISSGRSASSVPRDAAVVEARLDDGHRVFAFPEGADAMTALGFRLEPVQLPGQSIAESLQRPGGDAVVVAGVWPGLVGALGLRPDGPTPGSRLRAHAMLVASPGSAPLVLADSQPIRRDLSDQSPSLTGIVAETSANGGGRILVGGLPAVHAENGVAVVVAAPGGQLLERLALQPGAALRLPLNMSRLPLYEITGRQQCEPLGQRRWTDLSALAGSTGVVRLSFNAYRAFEASAVLYVSADGPLRPILIDQRGTGDPVLRTDQYAPSVGGALDQRLAADGVTWPWPRAGRTIHRLEVRVNDQGDWAMTVVGLGVLGAQVLARGWSDRPEGWRVRACQADLPLLLSSRQLVTDLWLGPGAEPAFGSGWRGASPGRDGPTRWMAESRATVLAGVERPAPATLYLEVAPRVPGTTLDLTINGMPLEGRTLSAGWQMISWEVPASAWRTGANEVALRTSSLATEVAGDPDERRRTVGFRRWRVERQVP